MNQAKYISAELYQSQKNADVKDCSISDGAIQTFPSWASRVEIHGKIVSLMQVPCLTQFHIEGNNFYSLSNSQIYFPGKFCGDLSVVVPETLLSKFAKRNAKVLHTQASSHASCSGEHHRSNIVN